MLHILFSMLHRVFNSYTYVTSCVLFMHVCNISLNSLILSIGIFSFSFNFADRTLFNF